MMSNQFQILLADDDTDDCLLFSEALEGLNFPFAFNTVQNGKQLMARLLDGNTVLPDALFLDLNMPLKNGLECLADIKKEQVLEKLRVIMLSTSSDKDIVDFSYLRGAHYFIRKPSDFEQLKKIVYDVMSDLAGMDLTQPPKKNFLFTRDFN